MILQREIHYLFLVPKKQSKEKNEKGIKKIKKENVDNRKN